MLITLISLMILSSNVFCQKIEFKQNGKDTFFVFDRLYGKWLANKLDSLDYLRNKNKLSFEIINEQQLLIEDYKEFIFIKDDMIRNYKYEISNLNLQIDSYRQSELIYKDIQKQRIREEKRKKLWKILAIAGFSTTLATFSIIILK